MKTEITKRPWGSFAKFTNNEPSTVKLLFINKGEETSLQYHSYREEFWRVINGNPEITIGDKIFHSRVGEELSIPQGAKHKVSAPDDDVTVLEISKGVFDENDIVRVEDKYGRG